MTAQLQSVSRLKKRGDIPGHSLGLNAIGRAELDIVESQLRLPRRAVHHQVDKVVAAKPAWTPKQPHPACLL